MTGENRITEMIKEMEQAFTERDALYKDRDEAVILQLQSLKQREELLKENGTKQKQTEEALQALEETLKKKEEELLSKEKAFIEEKEAYEKESREDREQLREEQIRLNLLQAKLQNEKVRQQTEWIRLESRTREAERASVDGRGETVYTEKEPALREIQKLRKENEELQGLVNELKTLREEDSRWLENLQKDNEQLEKECSELLSEKKELFQKLLAADDILSEKDPEGEEDIEYLPEETDEEEEGDDAMDRTEEFLTGFRKEYPHETIENFRTEDGKRGIRMETEEYNADIFFRDKPILEIGIPLEDNRKLRKAIQRINGEGGIGCRYERARSEAVLTVPFQPEDEPEDVINLMRCILDYEVPALRKEGGSK